MRGASWVMVVSTVIVCALPASSTAQSTPPPACERPEHRQFDFWIGEWDVTLPNGNKAGTNRIQSINAGCALREEWTGAGGTTGTSLNAFDAISGRWHQTWIGSDGILLLLDGGLRDGAMELSGVIVARDGARTHNRIRWTPISGTPATVRQLWEVSSDGGNTWAVAFDGTYRRTN
jgi:hypothetical protein